jgi:vancomycin resistance protein YoaR
MKKHVLLGTAGGMLAAAAALIGSYFVADSTASAGATATGAQKEQAALRIADGTASPQDLQAFIQRRVTLALRDRSVELAWSDMGATVKGAELDFDAKKAVQRLIELKPELESPAHDARLDLENRLVVPEQAGVGLDVYGSLARLRNAARRGASQVALTAVSIPPDVTRASLGDIDISAVLGQFTTKFAVSDKRRNDNLKLAASKLNGFVMMPGVEFSFNDIVGARTEQEGYKIAHVITSGEMVDGLAGGTCQISTTLHGAAFFAGLEVVKSLPHSRPSTYVTMGLDATVVYPYIDLKLRNPYDFPVVIHYRVARGESVVEILGKERPFDKVVFEREIEEELPFDTVTRDDHKLPVGSLLIDQEGFPGFKMVRYRKFYKGNELVKTDQWKLRYAPVTEYSRMGINPDPNLPVPPQAKSHGPRPPKELTFKMAQ